MKVRIVKQGNKFLAQYKDGWFSYWKTLSHFPPLSDWSEDNQYSTMEEALSALEERFQEDVVYEGEM